MTLSDILAQALDANAALATAAASIRALPDLALVQMFAAHGCAIPAAPVVQRDVKPANVIHRDLKPENGPAVSFLAQVLACVTDDPIMLTAIADQLGEPSQRVGTALATLSKRGDVVRVAPSTYQLARGMGGAAPTKKQEAATSSPGPTRGPGRANGPLEGNMLALLAKEPLSTGQLVAKTGALLPSVKSVIYRLRHAGKIVKASNRGGAWSLT